MRRQHSDESIVEMHSAKAVFQRIHCNDSDIVPGKNLGRDRKWVMGYTNLEDAFIDAEASVKVYYERCLARESMTFACGTAVKRIIKDPINKIATGAWSNTLINLGKLAYSSAIEVAWLGLTPEECEKWKNMFITTNLSTGFNLFPSYKGEMKCLRRSPGYCNTVTIPNPDDPEGGSKFDVSIPRTIVTNPHDVTPKDAEDALRDNLRELMPTLADRKFDRTKLCW